MIQPARRRGSDPAKGLWKVPATSTSPGMRGRQWLHSWSSSWTFPSGARSVNSERAPDGNVQEDDQECSHCRPLIPGDVDVAGTFHKPFAGSEPLRRAGWIITVIKAHGPLRDDHVRGSGV